MLDACLSGKVVVLGVGSRWRGDDAAGPRVVERLASGTSALCIDAGDAPERHLGEAITAGPEAIVVVDAVDFGGAAGDVGVFAAGELSPRFGTTHDTPLAVLMRYLETESRAEVLLIGIQPARVGFGDPMSCAVEESVHLVADMLSARLNGAGEVPDGPLATAGRGAPSARLGGEIA